MTSPSVAASRLHQILKLFVHSNDSEAIALFDGKGTLLHVSAKNPRYMACTSLFQESIKKYLVPFRKGDLFVTNDPFSGGVALHTLLMCLPIFAQGTEPVFFLSSVRNYPELDKSLSTLNWPATVEAEGIRIPPTRLIEQGKPNSDLLNYLKQQAGQMAFEKKMDAQIKELEHSATLIRRLESQWGSQPFAHASQAYLDFSEKGAKRMLMDTPDGDFVHGDILEGIHPPGSEIRLNLKLSFQENVLGFNFNGSSKQSSGCENIPYAATLGACWSTLLFLSAGSLPINAGSLRAVAVIAPEASVVNPRYPAPVRMGSHFGPSRLIDLILGCASKAMPFQIPAASYGGDVLVHFHFENGFFEEALPGGTGGAKDWSGSDVLGFYGQGNWSTVEAIESTSPLLITQSHIRQNSAGKGKHGGGNGLTRSYRLLENARLALLAERQFSRPFALFGGVPGLSSEITLQRSGQKAEVIHGKSLLQLSKGDIITVNTPGGGGWGKIT